MVSPAPLPRRVPAANMEWVHSAATRVTRLKKWATSEPKYSWSPNTNPLSTAADRVPLNYTTTARKEIFLVIHFGVHIQFWLLAVCSQSNSDYVNNQPHGCIHTILKFDSVTFIWESVNKAKKLLMNLANLQVTY